VIDNPVRVAVGGKKIFVDPAVITFESQNVAGRQLTWTQDAFNYRIASTTTRGAKTIP
jgi:hypothetical protein